MDAVGVVAIGSEALAPGDVTVKVVLGLSAHAAVAEAVEAVVGVGLGLVVMVATFADVASDVVAVVILVVAGAAASGFDFFDEAGAADILHLGSDAVGSVSLGVPCKLAVVVGLGFGIPDFAGFVVDLDEAAGELVVGVLGPEVRGVDDVAGRELAS